MKISWTLSVNMNKTIIQIHLGIKTHLIKTFVNIGYGEVIYVHIQNKNGIIKIFVTGLCYCLFDDVVVVDDDNYIVIIIIQIISLYF